MKRRFAALSISATWLLVWHFEPDQAGYFLPTNAPVTQGRPFPHGAKVLYWETGERSLADEERCEVSAARKFREGRATRPSHALYPLGVSPYPGSIWLEGLLPEGGTPLKARSGPNLRSTPRDYMQIGYYALSIEGVLTPCTSMEAERLMSDEESRLVVSTE